MGLNLSSIMLYPHRSLPTINTTISTIQTDQYPWPLLLEADPSREQVEKYIHSSIVTGLFVLDKIAGVLVLTAKDEGVFEISNLAVSAEHRGRGYGRMLLLDAICRARELGGSRVEIGTGNSSLAQLRLYQSLGFRIVGIDRDYFVRNYMEPIEENGIRCLDMIRLSLDLADVQDHET